MRSYRYLRYDVFTDHLFGGNPLSETTFVLPPEQPETDVRMRIFLATRSPLRRGYFRRRTLQGVRMGRPSHVYIAIDLERGDITSVRVGGEAVLAGEGMLYV